MKEVELHSRKYPGLAAVVDNADYDGVSQLTWCPAVRKSVGRTRIYAITPDGVLMHKLITGWPETDHVDHNGLNNRRYNLRETSRSLNNANMRKHADGKSRYKGVSFDKRYGTWEAAVCYRGNRQRQSGFKTEHEAAEIYNRMAASVFGDHACLNILEGNE